VSQRRLYLIEKESIAERGARQVTWFFRRGSVWTRVAEWPGVTVERLAVGPGMVWRSRFGLEPSEGMRLMCVESYPRPGPPRSPLDHLWAPRMTPQRQTVRKYFAVDSYGKLRLAKP
jgi:hypothetical protein